MKLLTKLTGASHPKASDVTDIFQILDVNGDEQISKHEYDRLMKSFELVLNQYGFRLLKKEKF